MAPPRGRDRVQARHGLSGGIPIQTPDAPQRCRCRSEQQARGGACRNLQALRPRQCHPGVGPLSVPRAVPQHFVLMRLHRSLGVALPRKGLGGQEGHEGLLHQTLKRQAPIPRTRAQEGLHRIRQCCADRGHALKCTGLLGGRANGLPPKTEYRRPSAGRPGPLRGPRRPCPPGARRWRTRGGWSRPRRPGCPA